jgi:hypothetical protein
LAKVKDEKGKGRMSWQYDRSWLESRIDEARKRIDEAKKRGGTRMHLFVFHALDKEATDSQGLLQEMETHLVRLDKLQQMMWYGTIPTFFRCGHWIDDDALRFDAYDREEGPKFCSIDPKAWEDLDNSPARVCCYPCSGYIFQLHLRYRFYRHLDLDGILPRALHPIIRSYLVP